MSLFSRLTGGAPDKDAKTNPTEEMGASGLVAYSGRVSDEFLPQLQGVNAIRVFREMADNDAVVGSVLFAIDMLLREVKWSVDPADGSDKAKEYAEFVESLMDDMSVTWEDFISEVMTMLVYGWCFFEVVYKQRKGDSPVDGQAKSKHDDKQWGVRKLAVRSQDTLLRWEFDDTGGLDAFVQMAPRISMNSISSEEVRIPISRGLLFRTQSRKNSPQGRSVLRSAYRAWWFKKRLEEGEAIGLWRNLTGLPIAYIPAKFMDPTATPAEKGVLASIQKMVRDTVIDEQAGVILPSDRDASGNRMFELTLLSAGSHSKVDARSAITDYNRLIAMTVLADFVMLGQTSSGSFALSVNKTDLFTTALQTWANSIAAVLNRYLLPPIWEMNGYDKTLMPKMKPGAVAQIDMSALGDLIQKMAGAGATLFPDKDLENYIRTAAGLPEAPDETDTPAPAPMASPEQVAAHTAAMAALKASSGGKVPGLDATGQPVAVAPKKPPVAVAAVKPASKPVGKAYRVLGQYGSDEFLVGVPDAFGDTSVTVTKGGDSGYSVGEVASLGAQMARNWQPVTVSKSDVAEIIRAAKDRDCIAS